LWWLTAGPEAGSLTEVLRKEKQQEAQPEPPSSVDLLRARFDAYMKDQALRVENEQKNRLLVNSIELAMVETPRRPLVTIAKPDTTRQSQPVTITEKKSEK
jgi:hypothetical protein